MLEGEEPVIFTDGNSVDIRVVGFCGGRLPARSSLCHGDGGAILNGESKSRRRGRCHPPCARSECALISPCEQTPGSGEALLYRRGTIHAPSMYTEDKEVLRAERVV